VLVKRRAYAAIASAIALLLAAAATALAGEIHTYSLPPDKLVKAIDYARARNLLHFASVAWQFAVLVAVLALKVAPRFRDWAERATRRRIAQAYIVATLLLLTLDLAELPLAAYGHRLSLAYGLSVQPWLPWMWDWTKGELLVLAFAGLAAWVFYGVVRRSPRRWWLHFWMASVPIVVFLFFIEPVAIEPLFFRFQPLARQHPGLAAAIQRVTERGGLHIPPERMFVMDASTKYTAPNAYVTGIGASARVVVWDTCFSALNTDQILVVFGHEMGHYVLGHIWIGVAGALGGLFVSLFLAYHALRWMLSRWGERWSIRGAEDWASLAVLLLIAGALNFLGEPIQNSFSRTIEHNADVYGLEAIHGLIPNAAQVAAQDFQIEGEAWLADPSPSPFVKFWLYDHPPVSDRLRFAAEYDPWSKGQPPRYIK